MFSYHQVRSGRQLPNKPKFQRPVPTSLRINHALKGHELILGLEYLPKSAWCACRHDTAVERGKAMDVICPFVMRCSGQRFFHRPGEWRDKGTLLRASW